MMGSIAPAILPLSVVLSSALHPAPMESMTPEILLIIAARSASMLRRFVPSVTATKLLVAYPANTEAKVSVGVAHCGVPSDASVMPCTGATKITPSAATRSFAKLEIAALISVAIFTGVVAV